MSQHSLADQAGPPTEEHPNRKKGRILIIDADDCTCDFLGSIIKLIGFEFNMVKSVEQAMDLLEKSVFDLLIADLRLPNSQQFLEASLEKNPQLQTIIMVQQRQIFFEAMRLPGASFIHKPFNFDDIVEKIHQAIHNHHLRQVESHIQRLRHEIFRL
ncbi:MAG: response regulator [Deltaproteobacteria bacterium]|nr:response regulator [Deltaproteobacteria bacterium]